MSGREDVFRQAMNQGHSAAWDQSWEQAAQFYRQALEEFPEHSMALSSLALALYEMQLYEEALRFYVQAAKAAPLDPIPVEKVSQIYERMGYIDRARTAALQAAEMYLQNRDVNKAIENWKHVTALQPDNLHAHTRLAMVYEKLERKQESAAEYLILAGLFQRDRQMEKALRAVQAAQQIQPNSMAAAEAMAMLRENKPLPLPMRTRGGTAPLRMAQVRQLEPGREEDDLANQQDPIAEARQKALTVLAGILFETSEEDSLDLNNRRGFQALMHGAGIASRSADRSRIQLHLGQVIDLQSQGNFAQAATELDRAVEAGLEHGAAYYDLGYLRMQANDMDDALRCLRVAVQHPDYALGARLLMGQIYRTQEQWREAAVAYLQALSEADSFLLPKEQAEGMRQLYDPLVEAQEHVTELQVHQQVCANIAGILLQPGWKQKLSQARQQLGEPEQGTLPIPLAEVFTQARSSQIVDSLAKIHQLDRSGNLRSAMDEAFYALHFAPTYLPLHTYMGELLMKQGQLDEARTKFLVVAQAYSTRGESRHAIQLYRRVIELAPMDLNPRLKLINQMTVMGQTDEALNEYINLAGVYYDLADLDKARKTYSDALSLAQSSRVDRSWQARILHRMADIDLQSLDWRQALRIFEQIRSLQPEDEKARLSLVDLNSRLGQEAAALAELDNYLVYLGNKGKREKAVSFLEELLREDPTRPWVRRRMAEFYQYTGRTSESIKQWDALSELLIDVGDISGAIQAVEAILALKPEKIGDYRMLLDQLKSGKLK